MKKKSLERLRENSSDSIMNYQNLRQLEEVDNIRVNKSFCYLTYGYYRLTRKLNENLLDLFVDMIYEEEVQSGQFTLNVKEAKDFFALLPKKWKQRLVFHGNSKQKESPKQKIRVS